VLLGASCDNSRSLAAFKISASRLAIDWKPYAATAQVNTAFASTINTACALSGLTKAPKPLKSLMTTDLP